MSNTCLVGLIVTSIIFCVGMLSSILLYKKREKRLALISAMVSVLLLVSVIGYGYYTLKGWEINSNKYGVSLSITNIYTNLTEELVFIVNFGDEEKSLNRDEINYKLEIWNVEEGENYQFEIKTQNFKFIDSNTTISGSISSYREKLEIENINSDSKYYQEIRETDTNVIIRTYGVDGNISFKFKLYYPPVP